MAERMLYWAAGGLHARPASAISMLAESGRDMAVMDAHAASDLIDRGLRRGGLSEAEIERMRQARMARRYDRIERLRARDFAI